MYFQDDWRVSSGLTVNLGLRYEMNLAPIYGDDILSNFNPSLPNPGADNKTTLRGASSRSYGPFTAVGRTLLTSQIGSAAAVAAGITPPFAAFTKVFGTAATAGQALRPYPQYALIDTISGGGDRLGHSTNHSLEMKLTRRYSAGLTLQASYVFSKALTDSDNYNSTPTSMDPAYNLRLERSIAGFDQTHTVKLSYVYDLPFGKGKRYLSSKGVASAALGGWRIAGIQQYVSGTPISVGTTIRQPVSFFGPQPTTRFGNETRFNPKLRSWPGFNENFSLARSINLKGEQKRLDFRWETFNLLNRTQFGSLSSGATLQNNTWGLWRTQANTQRRMQVSLKLYW